MRLEKITTPERRRFEDACGLAHAVELLGERWAILVLRELLLGARRFSELKADLAGISANVLSQRLVEMEERGLVRRVRLAPPASVQVYEATEWALELAPVLRQLSRWAFKSPRHNRTQPVSAVAIMLSMQTNFDPTLARDFAGAVAFRFAETAFTAEVKDCSLRVTRGAPAEVEATITCAPSDLKPVLYGGASLDSLQVEGNIAAAERFVRLFSLPPRAVASS